MEGTLRKRGEVLRAWRVRRFELIPGTPTSPPRLAQSRSAGSLRADGPVLSLRGAKVMPEEGGEGRFRVVFANGMAYELDAPDEETRRAWMAAVRLAVSRDDRARAKEAREAKEAEEAREVEAATTAAKASEEREPEGGRGAEPGEAREAKEAEVEKEPKAGGGEEDTAPDAPPDERGAASDRSSDAEAGAEEAAPGAEGAALPPSDETSGEARTAPAAERAGGEESRVPEEAPGVATRAKSPVNADADDRAAASPSELRPPDVSRRSPPSASRRAATLAGASPIRSRQAPVLLPPTVTDLIAEVVSENATDDSDSALSSENSHERGQSPGASASHEGWRQDARGVGRGGADAGGEPGSTAPSFPDALDLAKREGSALDGLSVPLRDLIPGPSANSDASTPQRSPAPSSSLGRPGSPTPSASASGRSSSLRSSVQLPSDRRGASGTSTPASATPQPPPHGREAAEGNENGVALGKAARGNDDSVAPGLPAGGDDDNIAPGKAAVEKSDLAAAEPGTASAWGAPQARPEPPSWLSRQSGALFASKLTAALSYLPGGGYAAGDKRAPSVGGAGRPGPRASRLQAFSPSEAGVDDAGASSAQPPSTRGRGPSSKRRLSLTPSASESPAQGGTPRGAAPRASGSVDAHAPAADAPAAEASAPLPEPDRFGALRSLFGGVGLLGWAARPLTGDAAGPTGRPGSLSRSRSSAAALPDVDLSSSLPLEWLGPLPAPDSALAALAIDEQFERAERYVDAEGNTFPEAIRETLRLWAHAARDGDEERDRVAAAAESAAADRAPPHAADRAPPHAAESAAADRVPPHAADRAPPHAAESAAADRASPHALPPSPHSSVRSVALPPSPHASVQPVALPSAGTAAKAAYCLALARVAPNWSAWGPSDVVHASPETMAVAARLQPSVETLEDVAAAASLASTAWITLFERHGGIGALLGALWRALEAMEEGEAGRVADGRGAELARPAMETPPRPARASSLGRQASLGETALSPRQSSSRDLRSQSLTVDASRGSATLPQRPLSPPLGFASPDKGMNDEERPATPLESPLATPSESGALPLTASHSAALSASEAPASLQGLFRTSSTSLSRSSSRRRFAPPSAPERGRGGRPDGAHPTGEERTLGRADGTPLPSPRLGTAGGPSPLQATSALPSPRPGASAAASPRPGRSSAPSPRLANSAVASPRGRDAPLRATSLSRAGSAGVSARTTPLTSPQRLPTKRAAPAPKAGQAATAGPQSSGASPRPQTGPSAPRVAAAAVGALSAVCTRVAGMRGCMARPEFLPLLVAALRPDAPEATRLSLALLAHVCFSSPAHAEAALRALLGERRTGRRRRRRRAGRGTGLGDPWDAASDSIALYWREAVWSGPVFASAPADVGFSASPALLPPLKTPLQARLPPPEALTRILRTGAVDELAGDYLETVERCLQFLALIFAPRGADDESEPGSRERSLFAKLGAGPEGGRGANKEDGGDGGKGAAAEAEGGDQIEPPSERGSAEEDPVERAAGEVVDESREVALALPRSPSPPPSPPPPPACASPELRCRLALALVRLGLLPALSDLRDLCVSAYVSGETDRIKDLVRDAVLEYDGIGEDEDQDGEEAEDLEGCASGSEHEGEPQRAAAGSPAAASAEEGWRDGTGAGPNAQATDPDARTEHASLATKGSAPRTSAGMGTASDDSVDAAGSKSDDAPKEGLVDATRDGNGPPAASKTSPDSADAKGKEAAAPTPAPGRAVSPTTEDGLAPAAMPGGPAALSSSTPGGPATPSSTPTEEPSALGRAIPETLAAKAPAVAGGFRASLPSAPGVAPLVDEHSPQGKCRLVLDELPQPLADAGAPSPQPSTPTGAFSFRPALAAGALLPESSAPSGARDADQRLAGSDRALTDPLPASKAPDPAPDAAASFAEDSISIRAEPGVGEASEDVDDAASSARQAPGEKRRPGKIALPAFLQGEDLSAPMPVGPAPAAPPVYGRRAGYPAGPSSDAFTRSVSPETSQDRLGDGAPAPAAPRPFAPRRVPSLPWQKLPEQRLGAVWTRIVQAKKQTAREALRAATGQDASEREGRGPKGGRGKLPKRAGATPPLPASASASSLVDESALRDSFALDRTAEPGASSDGTPRGSAPALRPLVLSAARVAAIASALEALPLPAEDVAAAAEALSPALLRSTADVDALLACVPTRGEVALFAAAEGDPGAPRPRRLPRTGGGPADAPGVAPPGPSFPSPCPEERLCAALGRVPRLAQRLRALRFGLEGSSSAGAVTAEARARERFARDATCSPALDRELERVLDAGNALNRGTALGVARGFRVAALARLDQVSSGDGRCTLLTYLAREARRRGDAPLDDALPSFEASLPSARSSADLRRAAENLLAQSRLATEELSVRSRQGGAAGAQKASAGGARPPSPAPPSRASSQASLAGDDDPLVVRAKPSIRSAGKAASEALAAVAAAEAAEDALAAALGETGRGEGGPAASVLASFVQAQSDAWRAAENGAGRGGEVAAREDGARGRDGYALSRTDDAKSRGGDALPTADDAKSRDGDALPTADDAKSRDGDALPTADDAKSRDGDALARAEGGDDGAEEDGAAIGDEVESVADRPRTTTVLEEISGAK